MTTRRIFIACGVAVAGAALGVAGTLALEARSDDSTTADRQALVAERGATVMPFDLSRTTHVFAKQKDGGIQTVIAKTGNAADVPKIRGHLREEAAAFSRGAFTDPAAIHGMAMPGLAALSSGFRRIRIRYTDVPAGGRIRYSSNDPALVQALHVWFDAQLMDHGAHAMPSMPPPLVPDG
jgi:hypothetical protein